MYCRTLHTLLAVRSRFVCDFYLLSLLHYTSGTRHLSFKYIYNMKKSQKWFIDYGRFLLLLSHVVGPLRTEAGRRWYIPECKGVVDMCGPQCRRGSLQVEGWSGPGGAAPLQESRYEGWRSGLKSKQLTQSDGGPGPGWLSTRPTLKHTTASCYVIHSFI